MTPMHNRPAPRPFGWLDSAVRQEISLDLPTLSALLLSKES
jgi:hypothetical protein